jgi:outer membrane protein OmpA-like peptidoglycan-associated protein
MQKFFFLVILSITHTFAFEYILEKTFLKNPVLVEKEIALSIEKDNDSLQTNIYELKYDIALKSVELSLDILKNQDIAKLYYEKNKLFLEKIKNKKYTKTELKLLKSYIKKTQDTIKKRHIEQKESLDTYKKYTKLDFQSTNLLNLLEAISLSKTPQESFALFQNQEKQKKEAIESSLENSSVQKELQKSFTEYKNLLQQRDKNSSFNRTLEKKFFDEKDFVHSLALQNQIITTEKELIDLKYQILILKSKISFFRGTLLEDLKKQLPEKKEKQYATIQKIQSIPKIHQKKIRTLPKKNLFTFQKLKRIHFIGNDEEVSSYSIYIIQRDAFLLRKMKDYKLELYGHTDNLGTKEENYELGLKRAQKTKEALVSFGIDPKKIKVFSKGDSEPIATNKTSKGRLLNRRVEFKLIKGK